MRHIIHVVSAAAFIFAPLSHIAVSQPLWQQTSLDSATVWCLAVNSKGDIFAGSRFTPGNLYRSTDNGESWAELNLGYPHPHVYCILTDMQGRLFASALGDDSTQNGIYLSSDNGNFWERQSAFLPQALITPDSGKTYLAGSNAVYGVFLSVDTCRSWTKISPVENGHNYDDVAVTKQGTILALRIVYEHGGILRSTDNGQTWSVQNDIGDMLYTRKLLIGGHGEIFSVGKTGVNRSWDDGQTWGWINNGISFRSFSYMDALAMDSNGVMYAGAGGGGTGLYRSQDTGLTWSSWTDGITDSSVSTLAVNRQGYLFAGTNHGVFRTVSPVTGVKSKEQSLPTTYSLSQNYPNPFNPITEIRFEIPVSGFVSLKIYNVLGQEVSQLISEYKPPGSYSVKWDGSKLPSGVYFYNLRAGEFTSTRKLLLVR